MPIYSIDGQAVESAYKVSGESLEHVYDINGELLIDDSYELKVMTFNVGEWYIGNGSSIPSEKKNAYTKLHKSIFESAQADICFLQEAHSTFCQDGTLADDFLSQYFQYIISNSGSGMSAHKLATKELSMSDYTETVISPDSYDKAYVEFNGKRICLINTHLSTNTTAMRSEADAIMEMLEGEEYFILAGDFNTRINSSDSADVADPINKFLAKGYNSANAVMKNGIFQIYFTYYNEATPNSGNIYATDHIITSANITIKRVYVDDTKLTDNISDKIDHLPMMAELVIH